MRKDDTLYLDTVYPCAVLAFDPGGTTGVFRYHWGPSYEEEVYSVKQYSNKDHYAELGAEIYDMNDGNNAYCFGNHVVCESFQYRQNDLSNIVLDSPMYIGAIKYCCTTTKTKLKMQTASQAKNFITDNVLKNLGWYSVGMRHANDAARHCAYYIIVNKLFNHKQLIQRGFK